MDEILNKSGADLEGAPLARTPSIFCRDRASDFVWAPRQKSMHQIAQIDFENYNFSQLLRGHIPLRSYETMGREHTCNVRKLQIEKQKKVLDTLLIIQSYTTKKWAIHVFCCLNWHVIFFLQLASLADKGNQQGLHLNYLHNLTS